MTQSPLISLNDGREIPQLGLGVWQLPDEQAPSLIQEAVAAGYRAIDTAAIYENERGVGAGIRQAGVAREELFVTTKLWNEHQGYDNTRRAFDASLQRLGLESVDLYLIHWPAPTRNLFVDTWRALIELNREGRARSIGVSNFQVPHLRRIIDETGVIPTVNQIELHPRFQQRELRDFHAGYKIRTEAWSPLGRGALLDEQVIIDLARKHGKTPAQIILRWHIENELIVIPKSAHPTRLRENIDVFNFALDKEDMKLLASLDGPDGRLGPNPDTAAF